MKNGTHLMLDFKGCRETRKLSDVEYLKKFLLELIAMAEMKPISEPFAMYYKHEDEVESGVSAFIIIADSNICIHTYPYKQSFYFDLFSCKPFNDGRVMAYMKDVFQPADIRLRMLER